MTDTATIQKLERLALQLRFDLLEMMGVGKAGHLGGSSSIAEIVTCLYFHAMRYNPADPQDPERDRFLLSKGHCVLTQYAALVELGVIPREELKKTKTLDCCLQGHPDMDRTPGIEAVTGSLGMGLSIALGMSLGLRLDGCSNRVYVIMGDGELSEGQIWEAAMAAAAYKADNITGIVDFNHIQATGPTKDILNIPDVAKKWKAFGWEVLKIDGHNIRQILKALEKANQVTGRPAVIIAETVKGKGFSFAENNAAFHNGILTEDLYRQAFSDLQALRTALDRRHTKEVVKS
jgi:transketolase